MEYYVPFAVPPPLPEPNISNWTNQTWWEHIGYEIPECLCPENGTIRLPSPEPLVIFVNMTTTPLPTREAEPTESPYGDRGSTTSSTTTTTTTTTPRPIGLTRDPDPKTGRYEYCVPCEPRPPPPPAWPTPTSCRPMCCLYE